MLIGTGQRDPETGYAKMEHRPGEELREVKIALPKAWLRGKTGMAADEVAVGR